jgi:hypothetical protein
MIEFHDKRNLAHLPKPSDYEVPLTRSALTSANRRFRQTGVPKVIGNDRDKAEQAVKSGSKARRKGDYKGQTVGEYLEFLNEIARQGE